MADSLGICHYKFSACGWGFEVFVDVASVSGNNSLSSSTILTAFFFTGTIFSAIIVFPPSSNGCRRFRGPPGNDCKLGSWNREL